MMAVASGPIAAASVGAVMAAAVAVVATQAKAAQVAKAAPSAALKAAQSVAVKRVRMAVQMVAASDLKASAVIVVMHRAPMVRARNVRTVLSALLGKCVSHARHAHRVNPVNRVRMAAASVRARGGVNGVSEVSEVIAHRVMPPSRTSRWPIRRRWLQLAVTRLRQCRSARRIDRKTVHKIAHPLMAAKVVPAVAVAAMTAVASARAATTQRQLIKCSTAI